MVRSEIIPVKYVFLDVVAYTKRTIEAQCYIIDALNKIVKGTANRYRINDDYVIYIPTGDGICIALLGADLPYDIHVTIAKEILHRISVNNSRVRLDWKKFKVRVGINQCDDNLITDINGMRNVAGAGINNARRIMDLADESQILVNTVVYENLHPRKAYNRAFSPEFRKEVKHGLVLRMHQLVKPDTDWLNTNTPSVFVTQVQPEPPLPKLTAYYFAHCIKNQDFILNKIREDTLNHNWLKFLLWFLAEDSKKADETGAYDAYVRKVLPDTGSDTIDGHFEWFRKHVAGEVAIELCNIILDDAVPSSIRYKYLYSESEDLVVNSEGKEKLKGDWPEIWDEFGLGELSGQ